MSIPFDVAYSTGFYYVTLQKLLNAVAPSKTELRQLRQESCVLSWQMRHESYTDVVVDGLCREKVSVAFAHRLLVLAEYSLLRGVRYATPSGWIAISCFNLLDVTQCWALWYWV